jgi:hypothetical protein
MDLTNPVESQEHRILNQQAYAVVCLDEDWTILVLRRFSS